MTNEPGFLITGSGRSGTGYTATVLQRCGLNVGHEAWWTLDHDPVPGLAGDVSWLGCFDHTYTGPVFAQVRNPLTSIPSIWRSEHRNPWHLLRRSSIELTGDWAVDAALIWLRYNEQAFNRADAVWRVEDLTASVIHEHLGVNEKRAERVLADMPTDVNAGSHDPYPWPDAPAVDDCLAFAADLGYQVTDPR